MKTFNIFIILLFIQTISFSQKMKYSLTGGVNYSYTNSSDFSQDEKLPAGRTDFCSPYGKRLLDLTQHNNYSSKGKIGFTLNNDFTFPITKYVSLKTGIGFSMNNINLELTTTTSGKIYYIKDDTISLILDPHDSRVLEECDLFDDTGIQLSSNKDDFSDKTTVINGNAFFLRFPLLVQINLLDEKLLLTTGLTTYGKLSNTKYIAGAFFNLNIGAEYQLIKHVYLGGYYEPNVLETTYHGVSYIVLNNNEVKLQLNNVLLKLSYKF